MFVLYILRSLFRIFAILLCFRHGVRIYPYCEAGVWINLYSTMNEAVATVTGFFTDRISAFAVA